MILYQLDTFKTLSEHPQNMSPLIKITLDRIPQVHCWSHVTYLDYNDREQYRVLTGILLILK